MPVIFYDMRSPRIGIVCEEPVMIAYKLSMMI